MHGDGIVVLRVFNTHIEADLAKSALEAAGIETAIAADDAGQMRPHMALTRGVAVMVRAQDVDRALDILNSPAKRV
jgi:hypothetical protein